MKRTLILLFFTINIISATSQTISWYNTPDGVVPEWGNWEYKDVLIPSGMRLDSAYGGFQRPGYPTDQEDYICQFNTGSVFDGPSSTSAWNYAIETNSLYNHWIDLTSFNFQGEGVVRVGIPSPAGGVWDSLGIAMSPISGMSVSEIERVSFSIFPNPANESITIYSDINGDVVIFDLLGKPILTMMKEQRNVIIDLSSISAGTYFIQQGQSVIKFIKN